MCLTFSRVLFSGLASEEEARDLGVLQRIRSLHWVRARHLELDIDDIHPTVKEFMDEAMKQLIFIDSKRSPKYVVISSCRSIRFIRFKVLQHILLTARLLLIWLSILERSSLVLLTRRKTSSKCSRQLRKVQQMPEPMYSYQRWFTLCFELILHVCTRI